MTLDQVCQEAMVRAALALLDEEDADVIRDAFGIDREDAGIDFVCPDPPRLEKAMERLRPILQSLMEAES